MSGEISIIYFTNKKLFTSAIIYRKSHDPPYTTAATKKSCLSKMPYVISSRSVTDGVSLSVSKSKLVYSSLIFVYNKLTLIYLLT